MNRYKLFYLFWLLPLTFLFLMGHQATVYFSVINTYENGTSYTAEVLDYEMKQIASQTNGYIVLQFETENGKVERKLSLPVEMAGELQRISVVPVRYQQGNFQEIVMLPTYEIHKGLALTNLGMAFIAFLISFFVAVSAHRYASKKLHNGEEQVIFERIDN
jgi:hypothetical protein